MTAAMRGGLVTESFAKTGLPRMPGFSELNERVRRSLIRQLSAAQQQLGPSSSVRHIAEVGAIPLLEALDYRIAFRSDGADACRLVAAAPSSAVVVVVSPWASRPATTRRESIAAGIAADARWCFQFNGTSVRVIDAHRTWSRQHLEFDLRLIVDDPAGLDTLWNLLRADALSGESPLLDRAVDRSARQGVAVCRALGAGVLDALGTLLQSMARGTTKRSSAVAPPDLLEQSLTVLYRLLFLMFAEARRLVPMWHPIYRDRYTIDSIVTALLEGRRYRGIWDAVQAISRLAHAGCRAGDLRVTAFNGRLFSPVRTPAAERSRIDDETMARTLVAVSTTGDRSRPRVRILYHDLDEDQLGAVYERVLDYEARVVDEGSAGPRLALSRTGDLRKASGTFYTPKAVTDWLVQHTLAPLVRDRTAAEILGLRIVDPAMGSGAFLVAACRYLAAAAEDALIRRGEWDAGDVTDDDRAGLRRDVALRCLYGADLNPMAVQLARLSLWLATLSHDKPLTFLDHHLVVGDSLVGVTLETLSARPPGRASRRHAADLPLFAGDRFESMVEAALPTRLRLALERDDAVEVVRRKESLLSTLTGTDSDLSRWKAVFDLWCAWWFWPDRRAPDAALYGDLSASLLGRGSSLPPSVTARWTADSRRTAAGHAFLHWELEFPEVFFDEHGRRRPDAGFDAVLGNPPWDVVRADSGDTTRRLERRQHATRLIGFVRDSGIYTASAARSHINRYQLFVERAVQIARAGGRIGLVLPSNVVTDTGGGPLRRHVLMRSEIDSLVGLDNRAGIFPIHRGLRFVLLTATTGRPTNQIACRFGMTDTTELETPSDSSSVRPPIVLTRSLLERLSGEDDLGIPEILSVTDLQIVERIATTVPWLSARDGWAVTFGRELNATDDREAFVPLSGDPAARIVLEGKQIEPFRVHAEASARELRPGARTRRAPRRPRLAYREIAASTNRLTLIAAIIPARAVTTHTLFVLRELLQPDRQLLLCALLNSYVANYLIRMRVTTHVTASLMSRLPVPCPPAGARTTRLADLAAALAAGAAPVETMEAYAELQAHVARLYKFTEAEFRHALSTFPLVPQNVKSRVLSHFNSFH